MSKSATPEPNTSVIEAVDPERKLGAVEDWGGKIQVGIEEITRNDVNYLDQQTTLLANTIARKLDTRSIAELTARSLDPTSCPGMTGQTSSCRARMRT